MAEELPHQKGTVPEVQSPDCVQHVYLTLIHGVKIHHLRAVLVGVVWQIILFVDLNELGVEV